MWRRGQWEHSSMWPWPSAHRRTHRRTDRTQEPWTFLNVLKQLVSSSCPGVSSPGACFLVTIPESCLEKSCLIEFRVHVLKKNTKYWLCHNCANTDLPYVLYFHVCLHIKAAVSTLLCCCAAVQWDVTAAHVKHKCIWNSSWKIYSAEQVQMKPCMSLCDGSMTSSLGVHSYVSSAFTVGGVITTHYCKTTLKQS